MQKRFGVQSMYWPQQLPLKYIRKRDGLMRGERGGEMEDDAAGEVKHSW